MSATTHSKKPNCQNFCVWNSHAQHDHVTTIIQEAAFSAVRFCSYTVSRTQIGSSLATAMLCVNGGTYIFDNI